VKFLLGPDSSGLTKAILPIVEKYGVPMVEGNGAARELFTKGYHYIFAVISTSEQYLTGAIQLAAENAHKLGKKPDQITIALAMANDPFAQDVRAGVLDDAARHGMRVVIDDQLPPELNDMAMTLAKIKALKPDMLVVSGNKKGAITAVTPIKAMKVRVPIIAMTHCDSAELAEKFAEASEHTLCAGQWHPALDYKDDLFGTASDFATAFKAAYGYKAPYQAAQSAASVQVFADALTRAQSLEPAKVRDAIAATELQTFFGKVKFDEAGRNIAKPMVLCQIRGGKYLIVAPKEKKKGEPVIPRPAD
jgi:branched-chain amino acid transport system substrate-binding protein